MINHAPHSLLDLFAIAPVIQWFARKDGMTYPNEFYQLAFLSFMLVFPLVCPSPAQVVCPGTYGAHLQGIAVDESNAIYWSFTITLVKTDATGHLLATNSVPYHHGDLTFQAGRIYVAVNLGDFNLEAGHAKSWVYVYDAEKLTLISKHSVPEVVHGAGGIGHHSGHFFVVGGLPKGHEENYVYEYDDSFRFLKKYVIKSGYTNMGIQTACFSQGYWWFGCYGNTLLKTDGSFQLLGKYDFDCALGIAGLADGRFLIGRSLLKENLHGGQVLSAKMDRAKGLVIVTEP